MKKIKYQVLGHTLCYNHETGTVERKACFAAFDRDYSEANEEIARRDAYRGAYDVEDDGVEEQPTPEERIDRLEQTTARLQKTLCEEVLAVLTKYGAAQ